MNDRPLQTTAAETSQLLSTGELKELIGKAEGADVDFKSAPYRLDDEREKLELAKDISAFANAGGGLIVIGVKTKKDPVHALDVVSDVRGIPPGTQDTQQIRDTIEAWVFPRLTGPDITVIQLPGGTNHIVSISVPRQAAEVGPFLVRKAYQPTSGAISGALIGYFTRHDDRNIGMETEAVHGLLRDGRLFRQGIGRPTAPATPAPTPPTPDEIAAMESALWSRTVDLADAAGFASKPVLLLAAMPRFPVDAGRMFASAHNEFTELLRHPPEVRSMGFTPETGQWPSIVGGNALRAVTPGYKGLQFWRDGSLFFCADGGPEWLGRSHTSTPGQIVIQPIVLAECTLLFCMLFEQLMALLDCETGHFGLSVRMRRLTQNGKPPAMGSPGLMSRLEIAEAPRGDMDFTIEADLASPSEAIAWEILSEVYLAFGLPNDQVPFTKVVDGQRVIEIPAS